MVGKILHVVHYVFFLSSVSFSEEGWYSLSSPPKLRHSEFLEKISVWHVMYGITEWMAFPDHAVFYYGAFAVMLFI